MAGVKTYSELFAKLKEVTDNSMKNDVAEKSKDLMRERIRTDVYEAYDPKDYKRTEELLKTISADLNKDTLELFNYRLDREEYGVGFKNVVNVIETGKNYAWGNGTLDKKIGARPFNQNTYNDLKDGKFKEFLSESMESKGFKIR